MAYCTKQLDPKSRAATLLLRRKLNIGYSAGPEFPGDTIRKALDLHFNLGYVAEDERGAVVITEAGDAFLKANHLAISL